MTQPKKKEKKDLSLKGLVNEIGPIITLASVLIFLMIQLRQSYQKQRSTILLLIGVIFMVLAIILWYVSQRLVRSIKMKKMLQYFTISLVLIGFTGCLTYMVSPSLPPENQLLNIFEEHNLNSSIVFALYNKTKARSNLIKTLKDNELKVVIFKKSQDELIEIIYTPEIDASGITIISELPEDEYCIGLSFFGIILDYVESINVDHQRVEFVELISKNIQGTVIFEAMDSLNNPLSDIFFTIKSNTDEALRGHKTGKNGKTIDFWIYSLSKKSIGSYYAVVEMEDANGNKHEVWRSETFRPIFKRTGDKFETIRAIINKPPNLKK